MSDTSTDTEESNYDLAASVGDIPENGAWELIIETNEELQWEHKSSSAKVRLEQDRPSTGDLPYTLSIAPQHADAYTRLSDHDYLNDAVESTVNTLKIYSAGYVDGAIDNT